VTSWLHLVPFDFESGDEWLAALVDAGFDLARPAVVAATGVTMYLTKEALEATLRRLSALAGGSTVAMTFFLPVELLDPEDRAGLEASAKAAKASGTPFVSSYDPAEILALARRAGFAEPEHLSSKVLADRYFAGRPDGLRPSTGEDFLIARA
jgi:methyltransferase (TIGR00027 family)